MTMLFYKIFGVGPSIPYGFRLAQNFHGNVKHGMHCVIKLLTRDGSTDSTFVNASCKNEKLSFLSSFATFGSLFLFLSVSVFLAEEISKKRGCSLAATPPCPKE